MNVGKLKAISSEFDYTNKAKGASGKFWFERYPENHELYSRFAFAKYKYLLEFLKGGDQLLDIGVGFGDVLYLFQGRYTFLNGIDPSKEMIELAMYNIHTRNLKNCKVTLGIAENLDFSDNYFDVVLLLDVFEHIRSEDIIASLLEIRRVLKPNGQLIIVTPSRVKIKLWSYFDNLFIKLFENKKQQIFSLPVKSHTEIFYTKREIKNKLEKANYELKHSHWVAFYPAPERPGFFQKIWSKSRSNYVFRNLIRGLFLTMECLPFFRQKMFLVFKPIK